MNDLLKVTFISLLFLASNILSPVVWASNLIGVLPFTNQRTETESEGLGFYIQAWLQEYLSQACICKFHTLNTLRLWQYSAKTLQPVPDQTDFLISGSYQMVLETGFLSIELTNFKSDQIEKEFEATFEISELTSQLQQLAKDLAKEIDKNFKLPAENTLPSWKLQSTRDWFAFREKLYKPKVAPEVWEVLKLKEHIDRQKSPELLADFAEGMIVLSSQLMEKEKEELLAEIETLLRKGAIDYLKNSRIHALLAEVYYLRSKPDEWVIQTANQALRYSELNDLALVMLLLSQKEEDIEEVSLRERIDSVNPWIWPNPDPKNNPIEFQKGLFHTELIELKSPVEN